MNQTDLDNLSHKICNLLQPIVYALEVLKEDPSKQEEYVQAWKSVQTIIRIVHSSSEKEPDSASRLALGENRRD